MTKRARGSVFCFLCRHRNVWSTIINDVARNGTPQTLVACERCGFVQADPMPSSAQLHEYYSSGQYRREFPPLRTEAEEDVLAADMARFVETQWARPPKATGYPVTHPIEIGCGAGRIAVLLDADAIELDPAMATIAAQRGANVNRMARKDDARPGGPYPFLYALQVLEHCPDPHATLCEWRELIAPGGKIHLQVPTLEVMYGGSGHFFQWPHVVNFTSRTLTFALIMAGFERVTVGVDGAVLWATAFRSESEPPDYSSLAAAVSWPVDDPAALVAKHDAAIAAARASRGVLSKFMDGESVDDGELRSEVGRLASSFDYARESVAQIAANLGTLAKAEGDAYEGDPWLYGYRQGKARQSAAVQSVLTAFANHLVVRATGGKS